MKKDIDIDERIKKGVSLFESGYNCAQSVVGAFCDIYDVPEDYALKIASSFGGGIGRMRLTCGAACGLFMLAGLENGCVQPKEPKIRAENYQLVQALANEFKTRNGALECSALLNIKKNAVSSAIPQKRTAEYYSSRPCTRIVGEACRIFAEYLVGKEK